MSLGTLGLAFLAGALSVLSPCVLPLLPIMVGSAGERASFRAGRARRGAVIGLFVATVGFAPGLDAGFFRRRKATSGHGPRAARLSRICSWTNPSPRSTPSASSKSCP